MSIITHEGTTVQTTVVDTETHRLVGWGTFADLADSIRMRLYGHLAVLAAPVVKEFHGDLLIDAQFVLGLNGPASFYYTVRHSGTNMGDVAAPMALAMNPSNAVMYHLSLHCKNHGLLAHSGEWYVTITRHALVAGA